MKFSLVIFVIVTNLLFVNCFNFPECDPNGVSWHAHPNSCEYFVLCFWGEMLIRSCAPGLHFNRNTTQCMLPELAQCDIGSGVVCETPDDPNEVIFHANIEDCSRYYVCFNGDPIERQCAPNLWWDIIYEWCNFPDQVHCDPRTPNNPNNPDLTTTPATTVATTTTTTTVTLPTTTRNPNTYDCPLSSEISFHPHTLSCWRYFVCINGIANLRDCATNLLFDTVTRNCTPREEATCFAGSSPDR